jgi:hypothetical protein
MNAIHQNLGIPQAVSITHQLEIIVACGEVIERLIKAAKKPRRLAALQ